MNVMKAWFLVLVLSSPSDVEQNVVIQMPDHGTCLEMLNQFVYADVITEDGERIRQDIKDKTCEEETL